ncbi:MAG: NADP-dependent isocitrate dehydrogenase, partial [Pseudomonadota bacterium]
RLLGEALDKATTKFLLENKSPSRKVGELDNRGSHFYLALYWAEALAAQSEDADLRATFGSVAQTLRANEQTIVDELNAAQGNAVDIGGYYLPDAAAAEAAMRPSATLNAVIDGLLNG